MAHEQRKLAAILAADVVGYSRLMGRDESGTLAHLATISSRIVAADLGERQRLHRRVHPLPACLSYTALANARRARFTRRPILTQGQPNERESTAARRTNSGGPPT